MQGEWVIQSFSRHFLDDVSKERKELTVSTAKIYQWRTWVDERETHRVMSPTTLEAASERLVRHMEDARRSINIWGVIQKSRFRLLNVNTNEEIPLEAFGM